MKILILFLALCVSSFAADAAKDVVLSQRKDDNSGNTQRNITGTALGLFGFDASGHPQTQATGTGVFGALAINVGSAGAFVVNGGALGTPSSGVITNLTGTASININGTVGATTPAAGTFTTGTANTSFVSPIFSSNAADPADTGIIRLGNAETIAWEASPTGTDGTLTFNSSEQFVFSNTILSPDVTTSITTPSTSFDLFNATATTINFAGAATTLNVGNASGTTNLLGSLSLNPSGSNAGAISLKEGTAPSAAAADNVQIYAPANVTTAYDVVLPAASSTGVVLGTNSSNVNTLSFVAPGTNGNVLTSNGTTWTSAAAGGGGTPGGSDTQIQYNNSSAFGANAGLVANKTTGAVTQTQTALGTTPTAGITLVNTTAAAAGAQQVSPSLIMQGSGWKTDATAAAQTVAVREYVLPVQGTSAPTATYSMGFSINGGAFGDVFTVSSGGTGVFNSSVAVGGSAFLSFNGRSLISSPADGQIMLQNNAASNFTRLQFGLSTTSGSAIAKDAVNSLLIQSGAGSGTFNDASTAGSGTVTARYALGITTPTFSATNSTVTNTVASSFYIAGEPAAGTNITNTASYSEYIAAGDVRWGAYGSGAATFDANGVITSVSDERKKDIQGEFKRGLADVLKLTPKNFKYKPGNGLDTEHTYTGFIAQDVLPVIPEAIGMDKEGFYSFADRPVTAAVVNAVKELASRPGTLEIRLFELAAIIALILGVRANLPRK